MAQTGGSSGSIVPASLQDTPMDFESFRKAGVSLGSGALLICDQNTCIVDLVKVLLQFFRFESCGKCTPCRVGTQRAYEIVDRISQGRGQLEDLDVILSLAQEMERAANCGLGVTAAVPIRDMLKHFRTYQLSIRFYRDCSNLRLPRHLKDQRWCVAIWKRTFRQSGFSC